MEDFGQRSREGLLKEAERIREQVRALKALRAKDPENPTLREEHARLKARYERIQSSLTREGDPAGEGAGTSAEATKPVPWIDPARLEPNRPIPPVVHRAASGIEWRDLLTNITFGILVLRVAVVSVLVVFILAFAYLFFVQDMRFFIVPTRSMHPTLLPMDRIVTVKDRSYEHGDIIVFPDPSTPGDFLAKRVVAVGGDNVAVVNRALVVNGRAVREPYLAEPMDYGMSPRTVARGEVFVLGDNRNESEDSYSWDRGVPVSEIRGRVVYVYMPFDRFHRLPENGSVFEATR